MTTFGESGETTSPYGLKVQVSHTYNSIGFRLLRVTTDAVLKRGTRNAVRND